MMDLGQNETLLLDLFCKGTLILILAGAVGLGLRRASAANRGMLWSSTLAGLLALPLAGLWLPDWNVAVPDSMRSWTTTTGPQSPDNVVVQTDEAATRDSRAAGVEDPRGVDRDQGSAWPSALWHALGGWSVLWLAGISLLMVRLVSSYLAVHGWLRRSETFSDPAWSRLLSDEKARLGLRRDVTLVCSDRVTTPMVCGFFRSLLVLPSGVDSWDAQRRRMVLRHELAHVERRDGLVQLVVQLACCLHWLNPLVWLAAWRYSLERERACDDRVLSLGARPSDYASHLLAIARAHPTPRLPALSAVALSAIRLSTVGMAQTSELEGRLLAILDGDRRRGLSRRAGVLTALGVITLCLTLAAVHPVIGDEGEERYNVVVNVQNGRVSAFTVTHDIEGRIADLNAPEPDVRRDAAEILGGSGDSRAYEPLVEALRDPFWEVRKDVATALGCFGDRRAVPELIDLLADGHEQVRYQAAAALGELADPRALDDLASLLQDSEVGVRERAAIALGKLGDRRAVAALTGALVDHRWRVRKHAAESLGKLGDVRALEALAEALVDDEWQVREKAVMAFGLCGGLDQGKTRPIESRLDDEHWQVRDMAYRVLGMAENPRLEEALRRGLADVNPDVRETVKQVLARSRLSLDTTIPGDTPIPDPYTPISDPDARIPGPDKPISMSLKDADLVETLRMFAAISDLNFVIRPGVSGQVTIELREVSWKQALEQILRINNLGIAIDGTEVVIDTAVNVRAEAEAEIWRQRLPLRTVMKTLSYSDATEVAARIRASGLLGEAGTVQVDRRTNSLIVRAKPDRVDSLLSEIEALDRAEPAPDSE